MLRRNFLLGSLGTVATGFLTSCGSSSSLVTLLNDLIDDGSTLVDIAFPQYAAILNPWVTQLTTFSDEVTNELESNDSVAQKIATIVKDAGMIVAPNLTGLPQTVITRVDAISALIPQIVSLVQQLSAFLAKSPNSAEAFFAARKVKSPSKKDLEKLRKKNANWKAKLGKNGKSN